MTKFFKVLSLVGFIGFVVPSMANAMSMKDCGVAWKAEKVKPDFVKAEKGKGREAWNGFRRANCGKGSALKGETDNGEFQVARKGGGRKSRKA